MAANDLYSVGDQYRLIEELGQGGMASVWMADDLQNERRVAIKFLSATYASLADFRARFEQEAHALRQLQGPNIVQFYGHGVDQHGRPYIVMELLVGEDFQTRLMRERRLSLAETSALITEIANALQRAHAAGIVHRDLKPANVFFAQEDGEERVKLVDFGIAKIKRDDSAAEATRTGTVFGTFNYMSPEQMKDTKDVDHRSDVWALGVIAFRAVTGELPFTGQEYPELFPKICYDPIPTPSGIAPDLGFSTEVDAFFARALARDRQNRFQTALELAEELENVVHSRPAMEPRTTVLVRPVVPVVPASPTPVLLEASGQTPAPTVSMGSELDSATRAEQSAHSLTTQSPIDDVPPVAAATPRKEQSTGGITVQPPTDPPRPNAVAASRAGRWAPPFLGVVVGVVIAVGFMWRIRPAQNGASPPPAPVTPASAPSAVATTASSSTAMTVPQTSPPPISGLAPPSGSSPAPASSATSSSGPPATPTTTATVSSTLATAPPPPRPVSRTRDSYCADLYPDKPYASSTKRSGCVKTVAKYCCP